MRFFLILLVLLGSLSEARPRKSRKKKKKAIRVRFQPATVEIEGSDAPELRRFFGNLAGLKASGGRESMLILGDSHQQCEDFGQALLEYLRDSAGIQTSGRNFIFPYPLARTAHRSDFRFGCIRKEWTGCRITRQESSCSWGICGWLASCKSDSISFSLKCPAGELLPGDTLGLFSPTASGGTYKLFAGTVDELNEIPYSSAESAFKTRLQSGTEMMKFTALRTDSSRDFMHQGFFRRPLASGLSLGISGTNGARLDHYLIGPDFERQLRVLRPGLILLALGTNDAFTPDFSTEKTREYLGMLLGRIRMVLPSVQILLIGPPDHCRRKVRHNPNSEKVNLVYSEMAEELELGFWNQQKAMGGPGSIMAWRRKGLATPDMVHFFPGGYALQARLLGRSMRKLMRSASGNP